MKTNILFIFFILGTSAIFAQNSALDRLFDKYSEKDGFTTVIISQYMFEMFKDVKTDDKDFDNLIKGLRSIRIIAVDDPKKIPANTNFYREIMKDLPIREYKELMVIKEKGQDVKFLVKEAQGRIVELLLISGGRDNAFICIEGNIDLKSIAKLSKSMNIQGMKPLEKVGEKWWIVKSRKSLVIQKVYFEKVDKGEQIIVQRGKNKAYALTPVNNDDVYFNTEMVKKIKESIEQVEQGKVNGDK